MAYGHQYGFAFKIARCFAFVGPLLALDQHSAIGNFIRNVLTGQPIKINGDGTPRRSFLYASDLARWLWTLILRASGGEAFNVGSSESVSIEKLAIIFRSVPGVAADVQISQQAVAGSSVHQYVPNIQKAEQLLGLQSSVPLDEAIRKTARFHGWK